MDQQRFADEYRGNGGRVAGNDQPCDMRQPCWQGKVSCMSNISKLSGTFGNESNCYAAHSRSRREILRTVPAFRGRSLEN